MEPRFSFIEWEAPSYIVAVVGVFLDHFSTSLGLSLGLVETNLHAAALMDAGLWLIVDMVLVTGILSTTYLIIHHTDERYRGLMLVFPLLIGFCRIVAAVFNFNLIL